MTALTKLIYESLGVLDEKRGNFKGTISDIVYGATDIDQTQFDLLRAVQSAVGYDSFRGFIAGDYEYQNAIYKASSFADYASRPRFLKLKVNVDVPDIFDRGTASTSATGVVRVSFNRTFYSINEVLATQKGGTDVGLARPTNITLTGFDIELVNSAGARIAGTVSWAAKGY